MLTSSEKKGINEVYRGFKIDAHREMSLGGDELLYYSVFRESDLREMTSGFMDTSDTPETIAAGMRGRVDEFLATPKRKRKDDDF